MKERKDEEEAPAARQAQLHIGKNRHGPTGIVLVQFDGPTTHFRDLNSYKAPVGY